MSFMITVYVPGAIVMAADSRQSIVISKTDPNAETPTKTLETINSDFVYKVFWLPQQNIGISISGEFVLGKITAEAHLKTFQEEKLKDHDSVHSITEKLQEYFGTRFPSAQTVFHIAGYKKISGTSIPFVYLYNNAKKEIRRLNVKQGTEEVTYGASWGGQWDVIASILSVKQVQGPKEEKMNLLTPIIWDSMAVQDAIDFAIYAVRTTIDTIRFQARPKNVGGPIDVLLVTPEKSSWIQRKEFRGQLV